MLCAVNTREGEGESKREKRGRASGQRLVHTHTHSHTHTHNGSRRTRAGQYVAAAPTCQDFHRASGTNRGLTGLGCFKGGSLLILSGGGVTLGDVWSVSGEFPDASVE